ncbi:16933_t:CDS:2, partial [Funneliformis geosporum]
NELESGKLAFINGELVGVGLECSVILGHLKVEQDKFTGRVLTYITNILKYWNHENDKSSPKEKLDMARRLLLCERVRENLIYHHSDKNSNKITFRYFPKGEIRSNLDGSDPVYPDDSPVDLKNDKFYESKEYDWSDVMSLLMTFIRGKIETTELVGKLTAEVVSDIVSQIEKDNEKVAQKGLIGFDLNKMLEKQQPRFKKVVVDKDVLKDKKDDVPPPPPPPPKPKTENKTDKNDAPTFSRGDFDKEVKEKIKPG